MKTKPLFTLLSALILLSAGCSKKPTDSPQGSLEGVITLEASEDHQGVLVQLRELDRRMTTGSDGRYSFPSVPAGTYSLLARDADSLAYTYDFAVIAGVNVAKGRKTTVPAVELPLFARIEDDLGGQLRWTAEDGPYLIARSLSLLPGSRLTIEPGTTVKFAGDVRLTVSGQLIARGVPGDSVRFTTARAEGQPGDWDRIALEGSVKGTTDSLSCCQIQYANIGLTCHQASPVINNSSIRRCFGYGIVSITSTPLIAHNLLEDNYGGISCESESPADIQSNTIQNNTFAGIHCTNTSSPTIADNVITGNKYGLYIQRTSAPLVWHNLLSSNEDALYIVYHCDPRIEANEIYGQQQHGIFLNNYNAPEIHQNNIYHNGAGELYLLRNQQSDDIQAQNNWWGTDDMGQIGSLIWDVHDNAGLGEVFLDPILAAPVDSAGPRTFPTM